MQLRLSQFVLAATAGAVLGALVLGSSSARAASLDGEKLAYDRGKGN